MASSQSHLDLILFSTDRSLHHKLERDFRKSPVPTAMIVARNFPSLRKAIASHTFDGLIVETKRGREMDFARVQEFVDPTRTFILAGSRETLLQTARVFLLTATPHDNNHAVLATPDGALESYFDSKLGNFVKGMKHGSAKDLHPMLIKTVERPLISHALRVTNGNQIKTAHLLGMNRNTLRKKIAELRIPVHREKARRD